jgi:hypothetical protein
MKLEPSKIRLNGGTQPRAALRVDVIGEYAELMKSGVDLPPLTVFFDGNDYWLADGFHRFAAARRAFPERPLECDVQQGTLADAQWFSYGVNKTHGLRRTNEDKERVVKAALAHRNAEHLSNVQIAEHCGVDEKTVRNYRQPKDLSASSEIPKMRNVTRGTTTYHQNTTHIGKHKKKGKKQGKRISPDAATPVLGHSLPNPMISLSLSPNNPVMAATTIFKLFDTNFVRTLIAELTHHLKGKNQ